ncbi:DUF6765 family protein [Candidatus Jidaibacter acanthamoebae]|nr:DUF6765 family protein [Candidatus Jidaibacter acanthamoeba]
MDIEFHYYINYLIAVKAGFNLNQAYKIAYSAQFVDDNTEEIVVYNKENQPFNSVLTQSYIPFINQNKLTQTYLCFHFIPGEFIEAAGLRKDNAKHLLATTPGSFLARKILRVSLDSQDLYQIGVASHAFADTWAHANFVGTYSDFNSGNNLLNSLIPNLGHADYFNKPDRIDLIWHDDRLKVSEVNNKKKFIAAAKELFLEYSNLLSSRRAIEQELRELSSDLEQAIGEIGQYSYRERINNYQNLALKYSNRRIILYNKKLWKNSAYLKTAKGYRWKDDYLRSDWYLFQKAAKSYKKYAWNLISKRVNN